MSAAFVVIGIVAAIIGVVHTHQATIDRRRLHVIVGGGVTVLGIIVAGVGALL